jgi:hypothetical protein
VTGFSGGLYVFEAKVSLSDAWQVPVMLANAAGSALPCIMNSNEMG